MTAEGRIRSVTDMKADALALYRLLRSVRRSEPLEANRIMMVAESMAGALRGDAMAQQDAFDARSLRTQKSRMKDLTLRAIKS